MNYALIPRDRAAKRSSALHEMRTNRIVMDLEVLRKEPQPLGQAKAFMVRR